MVVLARLYVCATAQEDQWYRGGGSPREGGTSSPGCWGLRVSSYSSHAWIEEARITVGMTAWHCTTIYRDISENHSQRVPKNIKNHSAKGAKVTKNMTQHTQKPIEIYLQNVAKHVAIYLQNGKHLLCFPKVSKRGWIHVVRHVSPVQQD